MRWDSAGPLNPPHTAAAPPPLARVRRRRKTLPEESPDRHRRESGACITPPHMKTNWTKVLEWAGYRVYQDEINEAQRHLTLWVRRKPGNQKLVCRQCGRRVQDIHAVYERRVRDLACFEFQTT